MNNVDVSIKQLKLSIEKDKKHRAEQAWKHGVVWAVEQFLDEKQRKSIDPIIFPDGSIYSIRKAIFK